MVYIIVITLGILSIFLGIFPAVFIAFRKYGHKKEQWIAWLLGGLFWFLALMARYLLLILITLIPELGIKIFLATLLAGVFETTFRVLLLLYLSKFTANTKDKLMMAGLGWGTIEAIYVHSIPLIIFLCNSPDSQSMLLLEGIEWVILLGGYERIITEIFHVLMLILVFYGIKHKLKGIENSEPIIETFFTRDPKPATLWIIIVAFIHFAFDFIIVSLVYVIDLILLYMVMTMLVGFIYVYVSNRMEKYPLFLEKKRN